MPDTSMPIISIPGGGEQFCAQCPSCSWQFHPPDDDGVVSCMNPFLASHTMTLTRDGSEIDAVPTV